jgi:hypothetical protein
VPPEKRDPDVKARLHMPNSQEGRAVFAWMGAHAVQTDPIRIRL